MSRVLVATECRFLIAPDGEYYGQGAFGYNVIRRYLDAFDAVTVIGRARRVDSVPSGFPIASGPGISFCALPDFGGVLALIQKLPQIWRLTRSAVLGNDAAILRLPGIVGGIVERVLRSQNRKYAVEVVGDPADAFSRGAYHSLLRPVFRIGSVWALRSSCANAIGTAYVTERALQRRYPSPALTSSYSSVDLPAEAFADAQACADRVMRYRSRIKTDRLKLLFIGGLNHLFKAPDVLLSALDIAVREYRADFHLTLIGDGRFREKLERQAFSLGLADRVCFRGRITPGRCVRKAIDESDVLVLPSRADGLPRVVIESMARGVPCVGTNVGGMGELLDQQQLVPIGDSRALARRLIMLAADGELLAQFSERGRTTADRYAAPVLTERRRQFYHGVRVACATPGLANA